MDRLASKIMALGIFALALAVSSPAFAQLDEEDPVLARIQYFWSPHVYLGIHGSFVGVQSQKSQGGRNFINHGGGGGLQLGSRLGRYFGLELDYTFSFHPRANGAENDYLLYSKVLALNSFLMYAKFFMPLQRVEPMIGLGGGLMILSDFDVAHDVAAVFGLVAGVRIWAIDRRRGQAGYGRVPLAGFYIEPEMLYWLTAVTPDFDTTINNGPISHLMGFHVSFGIELY